MWVAELLDTEGEDYDAPGAVAGAAIYHFSRQHQQGKERILQEYRCEEIRRAYADKAAAAEADASKKKQKSRRPAMESR